MAKKSWFKFYPQSWLGDPELRTLGPEVRGFWMDLLCYMSQAEPVGYLISATGKPLDSESIARLIGIPIGQVEVNLKVLLEHKICAFDGNLIYSRKMVRDSEKECRLAKSGRDAVQRRYQNQEPIGLPKASPKGLPKASPKGLPIQLEVLDINKSNIKGNKTHPYNPLSGDECVSLESLHPTEITPGMRRWYSPSPEDNHARAIRLFNDCLEGTKDDPENRAFRAENANRLKFVEAIKAALDDFTWEQLEAAIQSYTNQCDRAKLESRYRKTPNKFFEEGLYRQFIDAQEVSNVASS